MRLRKYKSQQIGDRVYFKWLVVVPPKIIEKLGWVEGVLLKARVNGKKLIIEEGQEAEKDVERMSYEEFKNRVIKILQENRDGATWTDIRKTGAFPQKLPSQKWVRRLEEDIGLQRMKIGAKTFWKL